eukprot:Skav203178  [mRNA]  locus=scaffold39:193602:195089:+ [translate_table: standard]
MVRRLSLDCLLLAICHLSAWATTVAASTPACDDCTDETGGDRLHMLQYKSQKSSSPPSRSVLTPDPEVLTWEDPPMAGLKGISL